MNDKMRNRYCAKRPAWVLGKWGWNLSDGRINISRPPHMKPEWAFYTMRKYAESGFACPVRYY